MTKKENLRVSSRSPGGTRTPGWIPLLYTTDLSQRTFTRIGPVSPGLITGLPTYDVIKKYIVPTYGRLACKVFVLCEVNDVKEYSVWRYEMHALGEGKFYFAGSSSPILNPSTKRHSRANISLGNKRNSFPPLTLLRKGCTHTDGWGGYVGRECGHTALKLLQKINSTLAKPLYPCWATQN
jgi:hypothetical protein